MHSLCCYYRTNKSPSKYNNSNNNTHTHTVDSIHWTRKMGNLFLYHIILARLSFHHISFSIWSSYCVRFRMCLRLLFFASEVKVNELDMCVCVCVLSVYFRPLWAILVIFFSVFLPDELFILLRSFLIQCGCMNARMCVFVCSMHKCFFFFFVGALSLFFSLHLSLSFIHTQCGSNFIFAFGISSGSDVSLMIIVDSVWSLTRRAPRLLIVIH